MSGRSGTTRITLGAVVLDSPDHTGRYIARDIMGGWAYIVSDQEGDTRARGNGGCPGGIDLQLRCAFLLAANQAADSDRLMIVVESRKAHKAMVELGRNDPQVVCAIDGRPVFVMTRPDERASFQVKSAAERAASAMLQERERAEWLALEDARGRGGVATKAAATPAASVSGAAATHTEPGRGWRSRAQQHAEVVALPAGSSAPRNSALTDWLGDSNRRIADGIAQGAGPSEGDGKVD